MPDEKVEKKKTMEIDIEVLQQILDSQKGLTKTVEELQKSNAALESIASKQRLTEAKENVETDLRPRVHFKKLQQGVVIGWPSKKEEPEKIKNELIINPNTNNPMGEMIKIQYRLLDGTETGFIDYVEFVRCTDLVYARQVEDKGNSWVVEFEDKSLSAKPLEVNSKFFNA